MPHTTTASLKRLPGLPTGKRDVWEDDPMGDDEEVGPSWTKEYVSGVKVRHYTALGGSWTSELRPAA
jgi:hypothetical protein